MRISVTDAKSSLTGLVRRADEGEEIVLTLDGRPAVRLTPVTTIEDRRARRDILEAARRSGSAKALAGGSAARSQDFLYSEDDTPT